MVHKHTISLTVNGDQIDAIVKDNLTLLDFLRDQLFLTGTKKGCEEGECGACTVMLDGNPVNSCCTLAVLCFIFSTLAVYRIFRKSYAAAPDPASPVYNSFLLSSRKRITLQCFFLSLSDKVLAVCRFSKSFFRPSACFSSWESTCSSRISAAVLPIPFKGFFRSDKKAACSIISFISA